MNLIKWYRHISPRARKDGESMPDCAKTALREQFYELAHEDNPAAAKGVKKLHGVEYGSHRYKGNGHAHDYRAFFDIEPFEEPDSRGRKGALKIQTVRKRNEQTYR